MRKTVPSRPPKSVEPLDLQSANACPAAYVNHANLRRRKTAQRGQAHREVLVQNEHRHLFGSELHDMGRSPIGSLGKAPCAVATHEGELALHARDRQPKPIVPDGDRRKAPQPLKKLLVRDRSKDVCAFELGERRVTLLPALVLPVLGPTSRPQRDRPGKVVPKRVRHADRVLAVQPNRPPKLRERLAFGEKVFKEIRDGRTDVPPTERQSGRQGKGTGRGFPLGRISELPPRRRARSSIDEIGDVRGADPYLKGQRLLKTIRGCLRVLSRMCHCESSSDLPRSTR